MNSTSDKIIRRIKEYIERCLDELYEKVETNEFIYGEKTAYVECLELLQNEANGEISGLNYNVEEKYPLVNGNLIILGRL